MRNPCELCGIVFRTFSVQCVVLHGRLIGNTMMLLLWPLPLLCIGMASHCSSMTAELDTVAHGQALGKPAPPFIRALTHVPQSFCTVLLDARPDRSCLVQNAAQNYNVCQSSNCRGKQGLRCYQPSQARLPRYTCAALANLVACNSASL